MNYGSIVMKISILFLFGSVFLKINCDVYYVPKITDNIFSCDNFKNEALDCDDLQLQSGKGEDEDDVAKMSGKMILLTELKSGYDIEIDIWKELDIGMEYMYNSRMNFCDSLNNTDTPWYPLISSLGIKGCPIPAQTLEVKQFTISLDSLNDFMCHEFCGQYRVEMSFMEGTDKITCHVMQVSIGEENDDK